MIAPHSLIPGAMLELVADVSETGCVTQSDRYGLQAAILTNELTPDEQDSLNRLLRAVVRGRVEFA